MKSNYLVQWNGTIADCIVHQRKGKKRVKNSCKMFDGKRCDSISIDSFGTDSYLGKRSFLKSCPFLWSFVEELALIEELALNTGL